MALKDDVLKVMPLDVELTTPQIAALIRPCSESYQRTQLNQRVYDSLRKLQAWDKVTLIRYERQGPTHSKVAVWMRTSRNL